MPAQSILAWLAIGLVVGVLGKLAAYRGDPGRMSASILIGVAGALIAGFVAQTMQWTPSGTWQNFAVSALGAVALVSLFGLTGHRRR